MSRFPALFVSCLLAIASVHCSQEGEILRLMHNELWHPGKAICEEVGDLLNKTADYSESLKLRIVEYTTLGSQSYSVFPSAADSLMKSRYFDPSKPTVIFIHGFRSNPSTTSGQSLAVAYKAHGQYNVLALDSSKLIDMFYLRSSALVRYIGELLGYTVYDLVSKGVDVKNIHLIGHSLGAHIAGFAGKAFQQLSKGIKIPRITGMDPAGPCFSDVSSDHRLDKSDADFVDVIHTNAEMYGINESIGHADFYPNGGHKQPPCIESICSHSRVWKLYEESVVRPEGFKGIQCDSWKSFNHNSCGGNQKVPMGMATPSTARGVFYLRTNFMAPFGLGEAGARPILKLF